MISVVMGVNKVDEYLDAAISSIICQTYSELELVIVANGPESDSIAKMVKSNFDHEPRVKVIKTSIGQLAHALNLGIDYAHYEYIARMDSDDVSHPDRLKKQIDYLIGNGLDMVGGAVRLIDERGNHVGFRDVPTGSKISRVLPFRSPFVHPTVLFRKEFFKRCRGYNSGFNSEDYDLWLRMKRIGVKWDNLKDVVLDYRIHSSASQRRLLGYAEVSGYALREFILDKKITNLFAVLVNLFKSFVRPDKSKGKS